MSKRRDKIIAEAAEAAGGYNELGRQLGISGQAVAQWRKIPPSRAIAVELLTGIPRSRLRPDLWG